MLTTLIVTQVFFDVGILILVLVTSHWLHERLREGSQVEAVLKTEEWAQLKEDLNRLATRLENKGEESLARLESRIDEARIRSEDLSRACGAAAEETASARKLLAEAEAALNRAAELRRAPVEAVEAEAALAEPGSTFGAVYLLADEMTDITEISRRTGLSQGEVEMILNLRSARAPGGQGGRRP